MRVTTKGQVTIPQHLREKYGITSNTDIEFEEENDHIIIKKKNTTDKKKFQRFRGIATIKMTTDEILSLTRGHR